MTFNKDWAPI